MTGRERAWSTIVLTAALASTIAPRLTGQSPVVSGPAFEAASVKPHDPADPQTFMIAEPNGRFRARNIALRMLIRSAYSVQDDQIVGPAWLDSRTFDVEATPAAGVPVTAITSEMQNLLAERFKLALHHQTRELPVYALVVLHAEGSLGPKLRRTVCDRDNEPPSVRPKTPWSACASISNGFGRLTMTAGPISALLQYLTPAVHRVVVDRTGLTGNFDVDLEWTPDQLPPRAPGTPADQPIRVNGVAIDPNGPPLMTAIQEQLGLKLEATKAAVDVLVVDRVEPPAAN